MIYINSSVTRSTTRISHVSRNLFRENNSSLAGIFLEIPHPIRLRVNFSEFMRDVLLSSSVNGKKYYCAFAGRRIFQITVVMYCFRPTTGGREPVGNKHIFFCSLPPHQGFSLSSCAATSARVTSGERKRFRSVHPHTLWGKRKKGSERK